MSHKVRSKQHDFQTANTNYNKYIYLAVCKQFTPKRINAQYKYFTKSIINHILKKYKYCHVHKNIEIDFHYNISILIVSNIYNPTKTNNITAPDCIVIKSDDSFSDLLTKIDKMLKLSYSDIKYIINNLTSVDRFNHIIKKPKMYLRQLLKRMKIIFYAIAPKSNVANVVSRSRLLHMRNKLKRNILGQYRCCILDKDFLILRSKRSRTTVSILIVANYHSSMDAYSPPIAPYHVIIRSSESFHSSSSSFMEWLCDDVRTNLSVSYEDISDIINTLYQTMSVEYYLYYYSYSYRREYVDNSELLKYAQQLSLYSDYKCRKYCFSRHKSEILVFGYIHKIIKRFNCIDYIYIPEDIIHLVIHFFYFQKTHEMSTCNNFHFEHTKHSDTIASLPMQDLIGWNALISKLTFKAHGIYSFKFKIINWCQCNWRNHGELRVGIVGNSENTDIDKVERYYAFRGSYWCPLRCRYLRVQNSTIEMIVNLTHTHLSLMQISWYFNGKCETISIFEMNKKELYSPFAAVYFENHRHYMYVCPGCKLELL